MIPGSGGNRARSNLVRSRRRISGVYLEDLCFDAQQAAEKALKALCIHRDIDFPYVHDLAKLLTLLEQAGVIYQRGFPCGGVHFFLDKETNQRNQPEASRPGSQWSRRSQSPTDSSNVLSDNMLSVTVHWSGAS